MPGPVDCWVSAALPVSRGQLDPLAKPIEENMARVLLRVIHIKVCLLSLA